MALVTHSRGDVLADRQHTDGSTVLRHLERHESGRIVDILHQGSDDELGRSIPLTEHLATAWAAGAGRR